MKDWFCDTLALAIFLGVVMAFGSMYGGANGEEARSVGMLMFWFTVFAQVLSAAWRWAWRNPHA